MDDRTQKDHAEKKRLWRFACLAVALFGLWELLGYLAARILYLLQKDPFLLSGQAASVGIIGGADGPTAIFITTPGWTHWLVPLLLVAAGLLGYLYCRKQDKR